MGPTFLHIWHLKEKVLGTRELQEKVINLKGIGDKTAKLFSKCGVETIGDLLNYFPRAYDAFKTPVKAADCREGEINA